MNSRGATAPSAFYQVHYLIAKDTLDVSRRWQNKMGERRLSVDARLWGRKWATSQWNNCRLERRNCHCHCLQPQVSCHLRHVSWSCNNTWNRWESFSLHRIRVSSQLLILRNGCFGLPKVDHFILGVSCSPMVSGKQLAGQWTFGHWILVERFHLALENHKKV